MDVNGISYTSVNFIPGKSLPLNIIKVVINVPKNNISVDKNTHIPSFLVSTPVVHGGRSESYSSESIWISSSRGSVPQPNPPMSNNTVPTKANGIDL